MALCGDNCEFEEFYNLTQKVKCLCEPQYNSSLITLDKIINKQKLLNNFVDIDATTNLGVIKCYKNLLSFKGLKSNIGSYIIITIILVYFIGAFIIAFIEYKILCNKIDNMLKQIQEKSKPNIILNNNINKNPLKINKGKDNKKRIKPKFNLINSTTSKKNLKNKNTKELNFLNKKTKKETKVNNSDTKIDLNNTNDSELNLSDYDVAKKIDKRSYADYYISLIKTKHPLTSSFIPNNDYNSKSIKICLFFFSFALSLMINSLFFTDETMHKIVQDEGIFNFIYNLPKILYSTLISTIIDLLIKKLALSEESILDLKKEKKLKEINDKAAKTKRKLIIKFILFFSISFIFLGVFWFYLGCFCSVYTNTQWHLLKDTIISFLISLIIPFIKNVLPCLIRINSLKDPRKSMYNLSKFLQ